MSWTAPTRMATLALVTVLSSTGCGDDDSGGGSSHTGGAGGQGGQTASGASSATGGQGAAGAGGAGATGGGGGAGGQGGVGGAGGSGTGCPDILITDGQPATCQDPGPFAMPHDNTTECPADSGVYWPAKLYEVPVTAGDCLHMVADNAGSPSGADLFGALIDPGGKSLLFDEESPCTVANPDGYACPAGGVTIETTGMAYVVVGSWEGAGCPAATTTPFQLSVSIDGVDVDLSAGELCAGDLLEIIP